MIKLVYVVIIVNIKIFMPNVRFNINMEQINE